MIIFKACEKKNCFSRLGSFSSILNKSTATESYIDRALQPIISQKPGCHQEGLGMGEDQHRKRTTIQIK